MATAAVTFDFVPGAIAKANDVDTNFNDLVSFLNNSVLHRDGSKTATAPIPFAVGSAAAPSITFDGDTNTGFYSGGIDELRVATGGGGGWLFDSGGRFRCDANDGAPLLDDGGTAAGAAVPSYSFHNDGNTGMYRSGVDLLSFATNGIKRVEIGSGTDGLLRVAGGNVVSGRFYRTGTTTANQVLQVASDVTATETVHMRVEADGDVFNTNGTYGVISDRRLKKPESIVAARPYLADLDRLQVRKYQMLGSDEELLGFIADEVAAVFPGLVKTGEDGFDSIKASVLVPMLLSAVQELSQRVRELEAKVL